MNGKSHTIYEARTISQSLRHRYSVSPLDNEQFNLLIRNVQIYDAGTFTCKDVGGYGPDEASAELIVIGEILTLQY